jgi:DMSO/TMAO reductase YedYZ molybdopterin-dependent catalytic subunit
MFGFQKRREEERRMKDDDRLPPGQALTLKFPVLHYGPTKRYATLDDWTFKIYGLVEAPRSWNWEEFNQLPRRRVTLDIHCVTGWSRFDDEWEGVHLQDLIDQGMIALKPEAKYCIQHCAHNYTTNLPIGPMLSDNFLLATHHNGAPLTPDHGYPLRGLMGAVPGEKAESDRYLWKGGKWLHALEFVAEDRAGFWEENGYSMTAHVWREERFWRR